MVPLLLEAGVDARVVDVFDFTPETEFMYFPFYNIRPERLEHDVPNCGYHILDWSRDDCLFYATDTGSLEGVEAKEYDLYLLEANHSRAELEARIAEKQARGEYAYEYRAAANHLSREQALDWLAKNAGPNSQYAFLHQHKETQT